MKRKVIKQGSQAYTLTLPIDWVRANNISEKTELEVTAEGKTLFITSQNAILGKKAKIILGTISERGIYLQLNALYARGIDEIEVETREDLGKELTSSVRELIGFALVSQQRNKYVIKDVGGGNYSNVDEMFKRVFQMILLFYEAAIEDIFGKQKESLEGLEARDVEINRFCLYLQRAINKSSYADVVQGRTIFTYSFALEQIGDEIDRAWRTSIKYQIKKTSALKELMLQVKEVLELAFDTYYQFNPEKIEAIYPLREKIREKSLSFKGLDAPTLRFLRHIVKIAEEAADLSHLVLMSRLGK